MGTQLYRTTLSIPITGLPRVLILQRVRAALQRNERVHRVEHDSGLGFHGRPEDHVYFAVWLSADSGQAAERTVVELHDIALREVLDALPTDRPPGWTSGFRHPEPVGDEDVAAPER